MTAPCTHRWRTAAGLLLVTAVAASTASSERDATAGRTPEAPLIPTFEPQHYVVRYMGITCGHMTLESRREPYAGRAAYHIVMTAQNSKFFNKIYKVDARIESWVDIESGTTVAYESVIFEKGETTVKRYRVRSAEGTVEAVEDGEHRTLTFPAAAPVLDPLAYIFRLQAVARRPGSAASLTLLTNRGVTETIARVGGFERRSTALGDRDLLSVKPMPTAGEMFSRKGEITLWIDPTDRGRLHLLDFKLSFGHLKARLK
jgi:hypothetical protein